MTATVRAWTRRLPRCVRRAGVVLPALVAMTAATVSTTGLQLPGSASPMSSGPSRVRPTVGAFYYLWNPQNLTTGTLRAHLVPPQVPPAAEVASDTRAAVARDITNAHQAGIDFFAVDWWPYDPGFSGRDYRQADSVMSEFVKAPNLRQMKFAMFYETENLGFDPGLESTPVTPLLALHFSADMVHFARTYFDNPSYLRIDGRPVVFLYLTRTLTGNVAGMMTGVRHTLARLGFDPYFIGDEVYWRVTPEIPVPGGPVLTTTPQVSRMEQFDAVTSYILYYGDRDTALGPTKDFSGYPGETDIVTDEKSLLNEYRAVTDDHVPVIPDVASGFNDRGFRLPVNHPSEPRQWVPDAGPASTLDHLFRCVAIPELDPRLPLVMVTSWNDWNEDTGIEPISGTPTRTDDSLTGTAYTQGYEYGDEGWSGVRTLRRDVTLLDEHGSHPSAGSHSPVAAQPTGTSGTTVRNC